MLSILLLISEQIVIFVVFVYFENEKVLYRLRTMHTIHEKYSE